ncbi:MAG: sugar phosphate nucleotidyltransferase [Candidatus Bathyarchaeota archaeon]|nr:sugar phosphate nucleotidyltransferase [Candidatus Bathyarchaeota archaeon]MCZ2844903.1 sugar phosphate nucleotidyltransferase [Candidatus Bathyarchaeota archaeon]
MKCIILAAGKGVRLLPITESRPKHIIPVGGVPLIERIVESLRANNIQDLFIVVGYKKRAIIEYLDDIIKHSTKIKYIEQDEPLGTADSIKLARDYVGKEDFMVIYGDLFIRPRTIERIISEYHKGKESIIGIKTSKKIGDYGIVNTENGYIKGIIEKPTRKVKRTNSINTGIYILNKDVFDGIEETERSIRGEYELTSSLNIAVQHNVKIRAVSLDEEEWMDIGYPWDLFDANERALNYIKHNIEGAVENNVSMIGPVILEKDAKILSGSRIEGPVFVGRNSILGPNCYLRPYTSIGKNVRIGSSCEVKNSIIMDGTKIPHLSYIGDSIIGTECNLGAGTITGNVRMDNKTVKVRIKNNFIDSNLRKLGAIIGDKVKTSINVNFMPGVKVGSNALIGPNIVVYEDILSREKLLLEQKFTRKKI